MKSLACALALSSAMLAASYGSAVCAGIPLPTVSSPLATTVDSYPFGGAAHTRVPEDLKLRGYVEEELLVSGNANVYDWPKASATAVVRTANAPYTTRLLIRRPAKPSQFSGNVIVEMLNPSNLFDLNLGWAMSHRQIVRNGDAWVGITSKPVSVVTLKTFNPARYERLSLANPLGLDDPRNCTTVAGDSARTTENGLVWDMYTQVAAWTKSRETSNPFRYGASANAPHPVQHVYGWGY